MPLDLNTYRPRSLRAPTGVRGGSPGFAPGLAAALSRGMNPPPLVQYPVYRPGNDTPAKAETLPYYPNQDVGPATAGVQQLGNGLTPTYYGSQNTPPGTAYPAPFFQHPWQPGAPAHLNDPIQQGLSQYHASQNGLTPIPRLDQAELDKEMAGLDRRWESFGPAGARTALPEKANLPRAGIDPVAGQLAAKSLLNAGFSPRDVSQWTLGLGGGYAQEPLPLPSGPVRPTIDPRARQLLSALANRQQPQYHTPQTGMDGAPMIPVGPPGTHVSADIPSVQASTDTMGNQTFVDPHSVPVGMQFDMPLSKTQQWQLNQGHRREHRTSLTLEGTGPGGAGVRLVNTNNHTIPYNPEVAAANREFQARKRAAIADNRRTETLKRLETRMIAQRLRDGRSVPGLSQSLSSLTGGAGTQTLNWYASRPPEEKASPEFRQSVLGNMPGWIDQLLTSSGGPEKITGPQIMNLWNNLQRSGVTVSDLRNARRDSYQFSPYHADRRDVYNRAQVYDQLLKLAGDDPAKSQSNLEWLERSLNGLFQ